jgi:hypothetical protein
MAKVNAFIMNVDEEAEWSRCAGAVGKSLHYTRPLRCAYFDVNGAFGRLAASPDLCQT